MTRGVSFNSRFASYPRRHYDDVIMDTIASQITSLAIVYSIVYSSAVQRKHQSSASLAFVWGIHRGPVNSPHKGPVTRKMFPFDDVIMRGEAYYIEIWIIPSWNFQMLKLKYSWGTEPLPWLLIQSAGVIRSSTGVVFTNKRCLVFNEEFEFELPAHLSHGKCNG